MECVTLLLTDFSNFKHFALASLHLNLNFNSSCDATYGKILTYFQEKLKFQQETKIKLIKLQILLIFADLLWLLYNFRQWLNIFKFIAH